MPHEIWAGARRVERVVYVTGVVLMVSGVVHLGVFAVDGGPREGPVSWRKAVTFGLSFGLTLVTIAWVSSYVRLSGRARTVLLGAFTVACVLETALVTTQAWRRVPSHFDLETPFDGTVARTLAAGGALIVAVIAALTVAAFRAAPGVAPSMRLAVRAGFVFLDVALLIGVVMIVRGMTAVFGGDQERAYAVGGFLKAAHAATMHEILVLPLLARLLAATGRSEARRVRTVTALTALCAVAASAVTVESATEMSSSLVTATLSVLIATTALTLAETVWAGWHH
ncbi:hypothetical protein [Actinomadura sp. DC4]|uniref:hypothetical protein n=1 Tax=Actinomadura sp. DC4 TaxID=3055069 RepID=UPI0025B1F9E0|nr:hypothetical protein [Actinomadura sp. DC4]MDN3352009.1 hypothetical protein [Actinomadura sp. DC4]